MPGPDPEQIPELRPYIAQYDQVMRALPSNAARLLLARVVYSISTPDGVQSPAETVTAIFRSLESAARSTDPRFVANLITSLRRETFQEWARG